MVNLNNLNDLSGFISIFPYIFFIYYIVTLVPISSAIRAISSKHKVNTLEYISSILLNVLILAGLYSGCLFIVIISDLPNGTQYSNWANQLVGMGIIDIACTIIYIYFTNRNSKVQRNNK